ncbi:LPXTG-motif cell wall anchor domain-containing protein [Algoriphagus faecimaris]|uniref:LPXTG-motif cell wall anchor domain-containing protein n=1 Tax=Algoriphagus faecimaris TaxID=686796 RepID=A0A1G6NT15_9BACT|nr:LPXTG-motif cell wall anchor domain-containing protein [Algoriphagus faecimaris]
MKLLKFLSYDIEMPNSGILAWQIFGVLFIGLIIYLVLRRRKKS